MDVCSVHGFAIIEAIADKSINENQEIIQQGKYQTRLKLFLEDPRFDIAVKVIKKGNLLSPKDLKKFEDNDYIPMKSDQGDIVLLKVRSITSRLHLTKEQVHSLMEAGDLEKLVKQAKMISLIFTGRIRENRPIPLAKREPIEAMKKLAAKMKIARDSSLTFIVSFRKDKLVISPNRKGFIKIYQVEKVLGRGLTGKVSSLINIVSGKSLAMKQICVQNDDQLKLAKKYLINEVETLNLLNPEGKVIGMQKPPRLIKIGEKGTLGTLCERYDHDYFEECNPENKVSTLQRSEDIHQLLQSLAYMHQKNFLHGDIKVENIFVGRDEKQRRIVALGDFGGAGDDIIKRIKFPALTSSCIIEGDKQQLLQMDNLVKKKKLSKIELENHREFEKKRDVFALGMVAYAAFTGNMPYGLQENKPYLNPDYYHSPLVWDNPNIPIQIKPLLRTMLVPDYKVRCNAVDALDYWKNYILSIPQENLLKVIPLSVKVRKPPVQILREQSKEV